jgi:hypothetical protein
MLKSLTQPFSTKKASNAAVPWPLLACLAITLPLAIWYVWLWTDSYSLELERPYIYRQFVPLAAGLISRLSGVNIHHSVVTIVFLCSTAYVFSSYELYRSFHRKSSPQEAARFVLGNVAVLFLIIGHPKHTYDVPTALFFTLALGWLQRGRFARYACLYPLICLNRETAFLLTLLFAIYFIRRLDVRTYRLYLMYQVLIYGIIRVLLVYSFADVPGLPFWFRPLENLSLYASAPVKTQLFLLATLLIAWIVSMKWSRAPSLMRVAFAVFTPALVIMYLVAGVTFEIRVFVELLPVIAIIGSGQ